MVPFGVDNKVKRIYKKICSVIQENRSSWSIDVGMICLRSVFLVPTFNKSPSLTSHPPTHPPPRLIKQFCLNFTRLHSTFRHRRLSFFSNWCSNRGDSYCCCSCVLLCCLLLQDVYKLRRWTCRCPLQPAPYCWVSPTPGTSTISSIPHAALATKRLGCHWKLPTHWWVMLRQHILRKGPFWH